MSSLTVVLTLEEKVEGEMEIKTQIKDFVLKCSVDLILIFEQSILKLVKAPPSVVARRLLHARTRSPSPRNEFKENVVSR